MVWARLTAGDYVAPRIRLYGIAHGGYSFVTGLFTEPTTTGGETEVGLLGALGDSR